MELAPTTNLRLTAMPCLFHERGRIDRSVPAGRSVADYLRSLGWDPDRLSAQVTIDGTCVDQAYWERVKPKAGHALVIRVIPSGGENGKTALRIVGLIAVIVAGAYLGGGTGPLAASLGTTGAAAVGATVSIVGALAISAPLPPPLPRRQVEGLVHAPRRLS